MAGLQIIVLYVFVIAESEFITFCPNVLNVFPPVFLFYFILFYFWGWEEEGEPKIGLKIDLFFCFMKKVPRNLKSRLKFTRKMT